MGHSKSEISVSSSFRREEEKLREVQRTKEQQTQRLQEFDFQMNEKFKAMEADHERELQKLKAGLDAGKFPLEYVTDQEHLLFLERKELHDLIEHEKSVAAQEIQFTNEQEEDIVNMLEAREEARGNNKKLHQIRESPQKLHMEDVGE